MKYIYKNKSNQGGIYKITNIQNGRTYYGSTSRFKERAPGHYNSLVRNKHPNVFLQNDWNKCGKDAFIFEVIEVINNDREKLLNREQYYLDQFFDNKKNCYNICSIAGSRLGSKNLRPYNPETDGRSKPKTEEWLEYVSAKNKIEWNKPERKKQASECAKKRWKNHSANITVTHKETKETVVIQGSVKAFCKERGISYKSFHLMVKGKTKSSAGWFLGTKEPKYVERKGEKRKPLSKEHRAKIAAGVYSGILLKHKQTGEIFRIGENAKENARELNISYSSLQKMLNGKCKSASSWVLYKQSI